MKRVQKYIQRQIRLLSEKLTEEFGKGFTITNLKYMRQFYQAFPKSHALRGELNWTQYRLLLKIDKPEVREFYVDECAKANWSSRQLERQINSFYYERLLASRNKDSVKNEISTVDYLRLTAAIRIATCGGRCEDFRCRILFKRRVHSSKKAYQHLLLPN